MKDDISTPTPKDGSSNQFEPHKPQTNERGAAEAAIEELRERGGVFVEAVRATRMPMALTDPNLPGNPIVFANEAFLRLTGYRMEEVLGQQPHFMNGPETDRRDIARFEEAIRADQDDIIETIQYRKNGTHFVATVLISAFKDDEGRTLNHFMSWLDVTRRVDAEEEITALKQVEAALRESQAEVAAELSDATLLRELSLKLVTEESLPAIYEEILQAAITIMDSDAGTVQVYDPETKSLRLLVTRGFGRKITDHFAQVDASSSTGCGIALKTGQRTFVDFDQGEPDEACMMDVEAGYRSAQATPLISRAGIPLGMLNTHWSQSRHRPTQRQLRSLDLLARQAADLIEQRQTLMGLRQSEARLAAAFKSVPAGLAVIDLNGHAIIANSEFRRFLPTGVVPSRDPEHASQWKCWDENGHLLDPQDWPSARALRGESVVPGQEMLFTDDKDREIWTNVATAPTLDEAGNVTGVVSVISDIDAAKRAQDSLVQSEQHAQTLLAELQHRVRNTLAVVRSMARRTAQNSRSADEMLAHFQGRLDAFSRVQAALTRSADGRVDLKSLIEDELVAHAARDGEQVKITGPEVWLDARSGERLSLAIHELTTNAVKHGALVNERGRIDVSCNTEEASGGERQLRMCWVEREVAIKPKRGKREGFGMELLLRLLPYDLQCETKVEITPTGLRFELRMPLAAEAVD